MDHKPANQHAPLDLSRWRNVPFILMGVGAVLSLIGVVCNPTQFGYSWLLSFMFFLSFSLGATFLVLAHHLFDAGWSVPIRRTCENISILFFPWLLLLFIPIALLAPQIYSWWHENPTFHPSLHAKLPIFTHVGFYGVAIFCFAVWTWLSRGLRYWSLEQDKTGAALPTYKMRFYSGLGVAFFAFSLTFGAIMWMQALQIQWFSTMYGVYYFAGSAWLTLSTVYVITMILDRKGVITDILHEHQYYFLGSLMFAFTVFYAYVTFAQYFIIWNGNMPEETFWYLWREKGTWWYVGVFIIFGHFFLPFLALLRIDVKSKFNYMLPICAWSWVMHWVDMNFNIMPVLHPNGFHVSYMDIGAWAFMAGLLIWRFLKNYESAPPYPLKDPRLVEAMGLYHPVPTQISGGELGEIDDHRDAPPQFQGGHSK